MTSGRLPGLLDVRDKKEQKFELPSATYRGLLFAQWICVSFHAVSWALSVSGVLFTRDVSRRSRKITSSISDGTRYEMDMAEKTEREMGGGQFSYTIR